MSHLNTLAKATTLLATAGLASATLLNMPTANAGHRGNGVNCEDGLLLGIFALESGRNQKFVKKDDGILKASQNSPPTNTSEKGVFQIYSLRGMPGATDDMIALRSTRSNKWWTVRNNSKVVKLDKYQCRSNQTSTTFNSFDQYGGFAMRSRKNGKWIKVQSDGKLKAKADTTESNTFFFAKSINSNRGNGGNSGNRGNRGNSGNSVNCENGQLLGTFALRSERNQKFVKKDNGILKATKNSQPNNTSDKGVFQIYSLRGLPGATNDTIAIRSARSGKWWRVRNNSEVVKLDDHQCRSNRNSTTFIGYGSSSIAIKSRKNGKWIKVQSNDKLKAKASDPNGDFTTTTFNLIRIR